MKVKEPVIWESIDWGKKTNDIAAETKVSAQYVSIQRRRYAPETLRKKNIHKDSACCYVGYRRKKVTQ